MKTALCLLTVLSSLLPAQQVVAPTPERTGEPRGANRGNYNIVQDWELGYRFVSSGGNLGKYRSDVNFGNGVRLLGSRLSVRSRDGHGGPFDELSLFTQGLGNDPYESASLRIAKTRLYRYDALWRSSDYYNPALAISAGQHAMDTVRRLQDHDFTLFPQSKVKFFAGFSRSTQEGPALATVNLFDGARGDEFPLFAAVRRRQNEFRFGNEIVLFGLKLNWMQAWELYREDSPLSLGGASAGSSAADRTTLASYAQRDPIAGKTPSFRLNLFRERGRRWAANGRFTYSAGRRDFAFDETAAGTDRFGSARNRQVLVSGNARRPVTTGAVTLSFFPHDNLTLVNYSAFHATRMEGDSTYRELENASLNLTTINFQYLGIRMFSNSTDGVFQWKPWLALRGGYQYSTRKIRSVEQVEIEGFPAGRRSQQENRLNAGSAGFRLRPVKPLTLALDGEIGRQDNPFYPTSEKDYHAFSARLQYRGGPLQFSATARSYANFNSLSLFAHSARSRNYSADVSWNPRDWFSLDAGYAKLHAYTSTGIAYFLSSALIEGGRSVFLSNLHTGHMGLHISLRERVDLYAGFSISRDAGGAAGRASTVLGALTSVQVFPMEYDAPLARISVKLHTRLRWNAGYQYYRYREDLLPLQNYRAHTGYTSVLWTF